MKNPPDLTSSDWARRVNRTWIVRNHLDEHAEAWLEHLENSGDGRLARSCENARAMCGIRDHLDDPKPWFYAGLFSLATADEARRFLASHPITKASIPAMANDEEIIRWLSLVSPNTRDLITRLRNALAGIPDGQHR